MIIMVLIFLIFLILIGVVIYAIVNKEQFTSKSDCVCAFDLDGTITCGIDVASKAIKECKEKGCKIAINTARPTKWYSDLDLNGLGLNVSDFDSDFYNGEPYKCSFVDNKCLENSVADTKVKHLHTLSIKWNVNPERIILFDDLYPNVERARNAGFSAIHANNHNCGLPDNVVEQINWILN